MGTGAGGVAGGGAEIGAVDCVSTTEGVALGAAMDTDPVAGVVGAALPLVTGLLELAVGVFGGTATVP